jgi:hypothetical protein
MPMLAILIDESQVEHFNHSHTLREIVGRDFIAGLRHEFDRGLNLLVAMPIIDPRNWTTG